MSRFDRTSNPAFKSEYFENAFAEKSNTMTVQGTINKIAFLVILLVASASFTWKMTLEHQMSTSLLILGFAGSFITAMITIFSPKSARFTAPIYAVFEGLLLGSISAMYNMQSDGLVVQALLLTVATLGGMLFLYKTEIIKPTERFKAGVIAATAGVFFAYLFSFILSWFGLISPITQAGPMGIVISLVIVVVAAFNLILDFDMIQKGAANNAPEYIEWYAAFGLMVTLIWLYLELLRLLSMLKNRD